MTSRIPADIPADNSANGALVFYDRGFHADADAAGTYYLFRICFPHVIAFLFYFFHTRKVSERDHA